MKVEIWHKQDGDYEKGQTLDMLSVSDENTCLLAYLHTNKDSLTEMQGQSSRVPEEGDIFVLRDPDADTPPRSYELYFDEAENPLFEPVDFQR